MTYIICDHSDTYNFTSKPEKGEGMLTQSATANNYARQSALIPLFMCFFYRHYIPALWLVFYPMRIILMDKAIV